MPDLDKNNHGNCCKDLYEALTSPPNSFFRVEDNGLLYLTIGYARTETGTGWFDQAVLFCPFCGKQLQTKEQIQQIAGESDSRH